VETQNRAEFEKTLAALPLATYRAGETILSVGSKTAQLLFLKSGAVAILKDSVEIARVEQPGAVIGEISALLDQPHTADVRALKDSQFQVADAAMFSKDPIAVLYVARILASRLIAADEGLVELKKHVRTAQSPGVLNSMIETVQRALQSGEAAAERRARSQYY
jgi:CRP/FNR family transcriptional regulator, cyclic AMP receptor protein